MGSWVTVGVGKEDWAHSRTGEPMLVTLTPQSTGEANPWQKSQNPGTLPDLTIVLFLYPCFYLKAVN